MPDALELTARTFEFGGRTLDLELSPRVWAPTSFAQNMAPLLADRIRPGMRVLELGLGSGVLAVLAGKLGAEVVGLDINPDAVPLARSNWLRNGLKPGGCDFRRSTLFSALGDQERHGFDLVWSNPPVLPALPVTVSMPLESHAFEVSGPKGRTVLDAMLTVSGRYLKPGGRMLVIATSLQGWGVTRRQLDTHWRTWSIVAHHQLELTDECTDEYVAWWLREGAAAKEDYITGDGDRWWHDVWFIEASGYRGTEA